MISKYQMGKELIDCINEMCLVSIFSLYLMACTISILLLKNGLITTATILDTENDASDNNSNGGTYSTQSRSRSR